MSDSNKDKNLRGHASRQDLSNMIDQIKKLGYIESYEHPYSIGMPNFVDQSQFKAPFNIKFKNNEEWLVFSTTTIRDRVKSVYWDAENIIKLNPCVERAYLVYPDDISADEHKTASAKNEKIQKRKEFSPLNAIITQEELRDVIENYALEIAGNSQGEKNDILGNNFEKRIADILTDQSNLIRWKTNDPFAAGLNYNYFKKIVTALELTASDIIRIDATSDKTIIGSLPGGGQVKTDVLTTVTYNNGSTEIYTISCKHSGNKDISIHQTTADKAADVLDPSNDELRRTLRAFQATGNQKDMSSDDIDILTRELAPNIHRLCLWALSGRGGSGDPVRQWARHLLVYSSISKDIDIHTVEEYCAKLEQKCTRGFKTPFQWTYQGDRGTSIQLKCRIDL